MGSSKKKGQQRKAAAKKAISVTTEGSSSGVSGGINSSSSGGGVSSSNKIVAKIRRGNNYATKKLLATTPGFSYEQSGVLSAVLEFLNRCEDETFDVVMASVGGDLKTPSLWLNILVTATFVEPSCKLQIAENIGPLISCMVNDTKRIFFKSNKHWREGIVPFVNLVVNVMESKSSGQNDIRMIENMQIVDAMLQYDGLLSSTVQRGFWSEYRPDIVKELRTGTPLIIFLSKRVIELLVLNIGMKGEGRTRLFEIGATPIVNKEYDPNCMTSYTAELVHRVQITENQRHNVLGMIQRLIRDADCVDKGVITEVIDWGANCVFNYDDALKAGMLLLEVMYQGADIVRSAAGNSQVLSDTHVAFAIRAGLIEMCMGFIERFGEHESFRYDNELPMHDVIICIFHGINNVSLHNKTAKAIRSKMGNIEALLRLEEVTNNDKEESLLQIKSIVNLNGSYCCRCNKSLTKTEVKLCNGCGRMSYCSTACQKDDWLNGHNDTCCKSFTSELIGCFQGIYWPEEVPSDERAAAKLKKIEINMNMIQLKLFLDNSETILTQAKGLDTPLCDCIVKFDLRTCPLTVKVEKYTTAFSSQDDIEEYEESRSKDNITCGYTSNMYIRGVEEELAIQRFFPHKWLKKQSK